VTVDDTSVAAAAEQIRNRIADAGGDNDRITLVAVTKGQPASVVRAAVAAGLVEIGESYAQELAAKVTELDDIADQLQWHFIGQLQRNKVRVVAPDVSLWQSVDRLTLGNEIARRAPQAHVLVQVNLTDDPDRGGSRPELVPGVVEGLRDLDLDVRGLMAVGPPGGPEAARVGFAAVAALAERLGLPERSMGMTDDLEVAVQEGATIVRIGTALFGARS